MTLDLATGTRTTAASETIRYSTAWMDGTSSGAEAVVEVNGETLHSATGSGYVDWTPSWNGTYTLTHKVMSGGEQIGDTLTATFIVAGMRPNEPEFSPAGGTIFDTPLSVSISCPTEGVTIHYTTDGSEPTVDSPVYRRFRISGRTTVKAIAEKDGLLSNVATAEYALGQCDDPVIAPADGASFEWAGQQVSINCQGADGVLRYTIDGREPTQESPVYEGPFTIGDSTVVKAKVFGDQFFDSSVVTAAITRVWTTVATPVIDAAASFTGSKSKVVLSCATEGADIYYTLDGSEPTLNSTKYTEPFYVAENCTVRACAVKYDYRDSILATQEIVKEWNIGDTMGKPDHGFTTDGSGGVGWTRVVDATAPKGEAMRSGAITHNQSSTLSTTVTGPGTLSFSWRTSCEEDPLHEWDHAEFVVDGEVVLYLDGVTAWTNANVEIAGDSEHAIEWRYVKDNVESAGEDAAWVANYQWISAWTATRTTEVPVPYVWLDAHDPDAVDEYEVYEASAKATAANGRKVWECYVLGLNPEDNSATNDFRITSFPMKADGTPDLANLEFYPPQARWNVPATYRVKGAANLSDTDWPEVTEGNKASLRFFRVELVLP